jgi:hypothetical protein
MAGVSCTQISRSTTPQKFRVARCKLPLASLAVDAELSVPSRVTAIGCGLLA